MKIGAIIVAAGLSSRMKAFKPMLELGGSTIIKKTLASLRAANIEEIVVIVGYKGEQLKKHLATEAVTIVENPNYALGEMFESVCLSLTQAKDWQILLITPVDIPLFTPRTVQLLVKKMKETDSAVVSPAYQGKKGHPVAINGKIRESILQYRGENGLGGALEAFKKEHLLVEVEDQGILLDADLPEDYEHLKAYAQATAVRKEISVRANLELIREIPFWTRELTMLLEEIEKTGSINKSCAQAGFSYSKGWNLIKQAEYKLGYPLLNSNTGGIDGGGSEVTEEAVILMEAYNGMESELEEITYKLFRKYFRGLFQQDDLR